MKYEIRVKGPKAEGLKKKTFWAGYAQLELN